jgi:hypothetical protein
MPETNLKTYLFIDESGDHGLTKIDTDFPVFILSGILIEEKERNLITQSIDNLKSEIWANGDVILHSRDIRKCEKEFKSLFDEKIKERFYSLLNEIISNSSYKIIASGIQKNIFIKEFGKLQNDVYEVALSFVIELSILAMKNSSSMNSLEIIIEKRGRKEDKQLESHFQRILGKGTGKLSSLEIKEFNPIFKFKNKKENINCLQLADLIAYPIARFIIDPTKANPAFDILEPKIYRNNEGIVGLKIYP